MKYILRLELELYPPLEVQVADEENESYMMGPWCHSLFFPYIYPDLSNTCVVSYSDKFCEEYNIII